MTQPQNPGGWTRHAACIGETDAFTVPHQDRRPSIPRGHTAHINRAKLICRSCPVLAECREWALTTPDPAVGLVAGGLTPRERRRTRDNRGVA